MAKPLSILFVTSEVYPYAKETGMGEVSYSLPLALRDFGHDIRIMTPKYGIISERRNKIHEINRLRDIPIPVGEELFPATVKSSSIANNKSKVQAYITTNHKFFDSMKGIYHDQATWKYYENNIDRFLFFSRSVLETCMLLGWFPDIIHCNDWHTAIIPVWLKHIYPSKFKKTKSVLTIHNFLGQPNFPLNEFDKLGIPKDLLPIFKYKNSINLLKGGATYSNYITTVSPSYEKMLLTDKEANNGLGSFFKENQHKFVGILNGVDSSVWDPRTDEFVPTRYDGTNVVDFKRANKIELCKKCGFEYDENRPIIGMISKLDESKGVHLFKDALTHLLENTNAQIVYLGKGDQTYHEALSSISSKNKDRFAFYFDLNESLSHLIEAGSDVFLLPTKAEPCGLNLIYAIKYGTVPVVHFKGGFSDVAIAYDKTNKTGNSFTFDKYNSESFITAINDSLSLFNEKAYWDSLIKSNISSDFSWEQAATKYDEVYRNIMKDQTS